jgi:Na+/H+ antiporter NhaD/arsenite permease-like protein
MTTVSLTIFVLVYFGVAVGGFPWLALDRTGIALLGAIAMIATGVLSLDEAIHAVDVPTILLLYALMIISAQLRLGGFYTWVALKISNLLRRPLWCLWWLMWVAGLLSAVLMNDIICLAFTPVLCYSLRRAGLNPVPYLLALAAASNIGSAATIIGNPQNMLIGQVGKLDFGAFLSWCLPPSVASLAAAYAFIWWRYRHRLHLSAPSPARPHEEWPHLNMQQTVKGLFGVAVMIALFFTKLPRELSALTVAGVLLCSRKLRTARVLGLVDWNLITLFIGLFVVMSGFETTHTADKVVEQLALWGLNFRNYHALNAVSVILSNIVSNVPATMLLKQFIPAGDPVAWYVLALGTTYAGNLILIGSIANLIVVEQAARYDIVISFREHATVGIPITLVSVLILSAWIAL